MPKFKTSSSPAQKAQRARYKDQGRAAKNKEAKLQRHLKKHPNDAQAQKGAKFADSRTAPKRSKGRLGAVEKLGRELAKQAKAGINMEQHLSKEVREERARLRQALGGGKKRGGQRRSKRKAKA